MDLGKFIKYSQPKRGIIIDCYGWGKEIEGIITRVGRMEKRMGTRDTNIKIG